MCVCCFQAEDGIRDLVRSRGLGDVYKRQVQDDGPGIAPEQRDAVLARGARIDESVPGSGLGPVSYTHLTLPTS